MPKQTNKRRKEFIKDEVLFTEVYQFNKSFFKAYEQIRTENKKDRRDLN